MEIGTIMFISNMSHSILEETTNNWNLSVLVPPHQVDCVACREAFVSHLASDLLDLEIRTKAAMDFSRFASHVEEEWSLPPTR
jgi:hypothetical protein